MQLFDSRTINGLFGMLSVLISCLHAEAAPSNSETVAGLVACAQKEWVTCGITLGTSLYNIIDKISGWRDGKQSVPAFGGTCIGEYRGGFNNWQWKYSGKFSCEHVSRTIFGQSSKLKSRHGAILRSMEDFVQQAGRAGVLTPQHIASYNSSQLVTTTTTRKTAQSPSPPAVVVVTSYSAASQNLSIDVIVVASVLLLTWFPTNA